MPSSHSNARDRGEPSTEAEVAALLESPAAYPGPPERVDMIETHCARIFLAGGEALKVKKRVRLPFLDFSTLEARRAACARELELNQPFAPGIYIGLAAITREADGRLRIEGAGPPVDWAVRMRQFDQENLLSSVAAKGPLAPSLSRDLAAMAARLHGSCPVAMGADGAGRVRALIGGLAAEFDSASSFLGGGGDSFRGRATEALEKIAKRLDARAAGGAVRRCHGDLHLGNIVLLDGRPVPFDALEFNEDLATIDVLYDLAFLLMDLDRRGDRAAANAVLNAYIGESPAGQESEGLACLPLFLACRAAVRAVVAVERARQEQGAPARSHEEAARGLLDAAHRYLAPAPPVLVAVGGLSGSGKSTLAAALAPFLGAAPGAIHLRSDVLRKRLFGAPEAERLAAECYRPEVTETVYRLLGGEAERILAAGHGVVADAVFATPGERAAIAAAAEKEGRRFLGLWLEAPASALLARVEGRHGDASDAGAAVVRRQLAYETGPVAWSRLDASGSPGGVLERALAVIGNGGALVFRP